MSLLSTKAPLVLTQTQDTKNITILRVLFRLRMFFLKPNHKSVSTPTVTLTLTLTLTLIKPKAKAEAEASPRARLRHALGVIRKNGWTSINIVTMYIFYTLSGMFCVQQGKGY